MKKIIKWFFIICMIPVVLVLIVSALLYVPSIQQFAVNKATEIASENTGMDIHVKKIHLRFPLNLSISGVEALSAADSASVSLGRVDLMVSPLPLIQKKLVISMLELKDVAVYSGKMIDGMEINGEIGSAKASPNEIMLDTEHAHFKQLTLSEANVYIRIDSISSDSTASESVNWKFLVDHINFNQVALGLMMPGDTLSATVRLKELDLEKLDVDLGKEIYSFASLKVHDSEAGVDLNWEPPALSGIDPAHWALSNIEIAIDSVFYQGKDISATISELSAEERSGISLSVKGMLESDSLRVLIPQLLMQTAYSKMELSAQVPWSAISEQAEESMRVMLHGSIGKEDIRIAGGKAVEPIMLRYPNRPITLLADVEGNFSKLYINKIRAALPTAFSMDLTGKFKQVMDERMRSGSASFNLQTDTLGFLLATLPPKSIENIRVPAGMSLVGDFALKNGTYSGKALLAESEALLNLSGHFNPNAERYAAELDIKRLEPVRYMPNDSLMLLEGFVQIEGKGYDMFKSSTDIKIDAAISEVQYKELAFSDITLNGSLKEHRANLNLNSANPHLAVNGLLDGIIKKDSIQAMLVIDADSIDLYGLQVTQKPFSTTFQIFSELETNLDKQYQVDVTLGNWELIMPNRRFTPKTLTLFAKTDEDTTRVSFHTGDFSVVANASTDPLTLAEQVGVFSDSIIYQLKVDSMIDLKRLRPFLPEMSLAIKGDKDNPLYMASQYFNVFFDRFRLNANTSPEDGFTLSSSLHALIVDTLKIDTISFDIKQAEGDLNYLAQVKKNRFRRQSPFYISVGGKIRKNYMDIAGLYKDNKQDTVLYIGANATKIDEGIRFSVFPENPILAYIPFKINSDNYFIFQDKYNMSADLRMSGDQLASLWLHSVADSTKMEALMLEVNRINLDSLSMAVPSMPPLSGYVNTSFRYEPVDTMLMVAADMVIDSLVFDNGLIGDLFLQGVYLPLDSRNHQLDMHLFKDEQEISSLYVSYAMKEETDNIEGVLEIDHMPLLMLNPMIPGGMAKMRGALHGNLDISGTSKEPKVNGAMHLDTAGIYIPSVGTEVKIEDKPIIVDNNLINIDHFKLYTHGDRPFVINGSVNARNLSKPTADLRLTADNMTLMNAPKTKESMLYGRFVIDLNSTIKGPLSALALRGNLHILGRTNVTYIMTDSPLTSKDRMSGLVTFTYFQDTVPVSTNRKMRFKQAISGVETSGIDALLNIVIDPAVKAKVELNEDGSNFVDLNGGGDLSFLYNSMGEMQLNGRYTLNSGKIKYDMPIIPNKELNVKSGSYIEFSGDPMEPYLNLIATERVRTAVANDDGSTRMVNFDAGIVIKETMNNLSLKFTLDAPEDMEVKNELAAMGDEERSKQAVTMLVTGIYLAGGGGGSGLDMNAALSSFLNNEINNIAGSALKGIDISVGMETYNRDGVGEQTDFSFRFSKRFFNDRVNVILGGRIATGEGAEGNQSFIDDATIEYRLDDGGTRYVKVFHNKNYENLLEGEVMQTGAGIVFRKRMQKINELFFTRKKKKQLMLEEKEKEKEETSEVEKNVYHEEKKNEEAK